MLQSNQQKQEGGTHPHSQPTGDKQTPQDTAERTKTKQTGILEPILTTEEKLATPAFGFCAIKQGLGQNEQMPQQILSSFGQVNEINQNSSHFGTQRPPQSLLTPTLFMKGSHVNSSHSMRSGLSQIQCSGAIPNSEQLNYYSTNAANWKMSQNQNDRENIRNGANQLMAPHSNSDFTVLGTAKNTLQNESVYKFNSPPKSKSIAQRNINFQQHVQESPLSARKVMICQQTTPPQYSKLSEEDAEMNASGSKNKENINMSNIIKDPKDLQYEEESKGSGENIKGRSSSPDKSSHLQYQMMEKNDSLSNSCQKSYRGLGNLILNNTANLPLIGGHQILNQLSGVNFVEKMPSRHACSTSQNEFLTQHKTSSPIAKGLRSTPKGSPFLFRMNPIDSSFITSLNIKMDAHEEDHNNLYSQVMHKQNERSSSFHQGNGFDTMRIFNSELNEEVIHQLRSLRPTPQRAAGGNQQSGRKELKARKLFQSPNKEASSNQYYQYNNVNQSQIIDSNINSGTVLQSNQQSGSLLSCQVKQTSNSKAQGMLSDPPTDNLGNNNSLNQTLFDQHDHPFDNQIISNNSAQSRLDSMMEGPNSGDSGRKMQQIISNRKPIETASQHNPTQNYHSDFYSNNLLQSNSIVRRLGNNFEIQEINPNLLDDHNHNQQSAYNTDIEVDGDHHFSFNNDFQLNNVPMFQDAINQQFIKRLPHGGQQMRQNGHYQSSNKGTTSSRNTQMYDSGANTQRNISIMPFGNYQNEQVNQTILHQCKCGANYPIQPLQQLQQPSLNIVNKYHHNHPANANDIQRQRQRTHNHHIVVPRHNHGSINTNGGAGHLQRSHSLKHSHIHRQPIQHMHFSVGKGGGLYEKDMEPSMQPISDEFIRQINLSHGNFVNSSIQVNCYRIGSDSHHQQQHRSSQSYQNVEAQSKTNLLDVQQNEGQDALQKIVTNQEDQDQEFFEKNVNVTDIINDLKQKQESMSSENKNISGSKKRLYTQFLDSSNKKTTATPSTDSCCQNSNKKSNQKSNLKKRQQEINNNNQVSTFDVQPQIQSQQPTHTDESKFQTPKGPGNYHNHQQNSVKVGTTHAFGAIQQKYFSTPNIDKDGQLKRQTSIQKTHQDIYQNSIANHQNHQSILGSDGIIKGNDSHSDTKMHIMESGEKNNQSAIPRPTCNCKKSKCLKLYCDCFAIGLGCGPECNCQDCCNVVENELRRETIEAIILRNPNAFKPKIQGETRIHSKGCHCKKSGCLKKYCECFQSGVCCTDKCVCDGCKNCLEGQKHPHGNNFASSLESLKDHNEDESDHEMLDEFIEISAFNQHPEEEKMMVRQETQIQDRQIMNNQRHHQSLSLKNESTFIQEEDPSGKKLRAGRSITQDLEKLNLSDNKNMASPDSGAVMDNFESKHSTRKRRIIDSNPTLNLCQHESLQPSNISSPIPISKKIKHATQSSAKATDKNLANQVTDTSFLGLAAQSSNKKKSARQMSETKKSPIQEYQNQQSTTFQAQEGASAVSGTKQIEHSTPAPSSKQIIGTQQVCQQSSISNPVVSSVTTRSRRRQLEASNTLLSTDKKPQQ